MPDQPSRTAYFIVVAVYVFALVGLLALAAFLAQKIVPVVCGG